MNKLSVPINAKLIGELYLRQGPDTDVAGWIEDVLESYLERTAADTDWSEAYYIYREKQTGKGSFAQEFGDSKGGYHWAPLFLPNGTLINMKYKKQTFHALVKFGKIYYSNQIYTPSELARTIASDTSRNAWRDLYLKRPSDSVWMLADDLRRVMLKE